MYPHTNADARVGCKTKDTFSGKTNKSKCSPLTMPCKHVLFRFVSCNVLVHSLCSGGCTAGTFATALTSSTASRSLVASCPTTVCLTVSITLLATSCTLTGLELRCAGVEARPGAVVLTLSTTTATATASDSTTPSDPTLGRVLCLAAARTTTAGLRNAATRLRDSTLTRDAGWSSADETFQSSGSCAVTSTGLMLLRLLSGSILTLCNAGRRNAATIDLRCGSLLAECRGRARYTALLGLRYRCYRLCACRCACLSWRRILHVLRLLIHLCDFFSRCFFGCLLEHGPLDLDS